MSFRYSCFISYRRTNQTIVERFVRDLKDALSYELAPLVDLGIFIDTSGIEAGEPWEQSLATALCQSVAMVMVFTPTYFSQNYPHCAREFKAMEKLEHQRLKVLGRSYQNESLIFPVILRGAGRMPEELQRRQNFNFDRFLLGDTKIYRSPRFLQQVRTIAESIAGLYERFQRSGEDLSVNCTTFQLPSIQEVEPWLRTVTAPAMSFPLQKENP